MPRCSLSILFCVLVSSDFNLDGTEPSAFLCCNIRSRTAFFSPSSNLALSNCERLWRTDLFFLLHFKRSSALLRLLSLVPVLVNVFADFIPVLSSRKTTCPVHNIQSDPGLLIALPGLANFYVTCVTWEKDFTRIQHWTISRELQLICAHINKHAKNIRCCNTMHAC